MHPNLRTFAFAMAGAAAGAALTIVGARLAFPPPGIASVDVRQLIEERIRQIGARQGDDAHRQQDTQAFAAALEASLDEIALEEHALILVGPAVLRGAPDLTDEVRERIRVHLDAGVASPGGAVP